MNRNQKAVGTMRRTVTALIGMAAVFCLTGGPADASGDCVSRAEYDRTHRGMRVLEVAQLYDLYGSYIGDRDDEQRRAYRTCWAPGERRVIVEFSYDDGESVDWYVRDVPA